jgi:hypothetical protein
MAISSPGEHRVVAVPTLKHIRRTLNLCEEDGIDSEAFYKGGLRVDTFINDYRVILRKLASR